jgi:hypothetical protein
MPIPIHWQVPTKLSAAEQHVADKLHRIGKFYVFLREIRSTSGGSWPWGASAPAPPRFLKARWGNSGRARRDGLP